MSIITSVFNTIFYEPLLNGLVLLVNFIPMHDVGIAVIILTIIARFVLLPFSHSSILTQIKMKELDPEIKRIKNNYKSDNQEQSKKIMELYKAHGVNPLSGCFTVILQIPIIFALYKVFLIGMNFNPEHLYSFVAMPAVIKMNFLGLIDMTQRSYLFAVLAGLTQFWQMKLAMPTIKNDTNSNSFGDNLAKSMSVQAKYIMPVFIFFIGLKFSSAISLYWTTMNVFAIIHETIVRGKAKKIYESKTGNNQTNNKGGLGKNDR